MPKIERLKLTNFKSFKCVDVELGDFNVLIGPNAAGKSNFVDAFRLLRDIANHDLENAISLQGGIEYLQNIGSGRGDAVSVEVVFDLQGKLAGPPVPHDEGPLTIRPYSAKYQLKISGDPGSTTINRPQEELTIYSRYAHEKDSKGHELESPEEAEEVARYRVHILLDEKELKYRYLKLHGTNLEREQVIPRPVRFDIRGIPKGEELALLSLPFLGYPFVPIHYVFSDLAIYDFDPKLPKKAVPFTAKSDLEEDGSNLAIVLKNILSDTEKRSEFIKLVQDVLPFVKDLDVDKFADQSMLAKIHEKYTPEVGLPAYLISDGTINIVALIAGLYFQRNPLKIFEEPNRNLHPLLTSRIVNMLKEAAEGKQIIVTTHNPEMVRHVGIDDLLFIARDEEGFSTISRPADSHRVQEFLKDDIGIEELHVAGLLGDNL